MPLTCEQKWVCWRREWEAEKRTETHKEFSRIDGEYVCTACGLPDSMWRQAECTPEISPEEPAQPKGMI